MKKSLLLASLLIATLIGSPVIAEDSLKISDFRTTTTITQNPYYDLSSEEDKFNSTFVQPLPFNPITDKVTMYFENPLPSVNNTFEVDPYLEIIIPAGTPPDYKWAAGEPGVPRVVMNLYFDGEWYNLNQNIEYLKWGAATDLSIGSTTMNLKVVREVLEKAGLIIPPWIYPISSAQIMTLTTEGPNGQFSGVVTRLVDKTSYDGQ